MGDDPPRAAGLPAGYDQDDPYDEATLATYPDWWRQNVELFREHGMRPYRPSRFADDAVVPEVVDRLEAALDVEISLRAVAPTEHSEWVVTVDGEQVGTLDRERTTKAFTRYEVDAATFERLVRDAVE